MRPERHIEGAPGRRSPLSGSAVWAALRDADHIPVIESVRLLRLARRSAVKARTQAANQIHSVIDTAPEELRAQLIGLPTAVRITHRTSLSDVHHPPAGSSGWVPAALDLGRAGTLPSARLVPKSGGTLRGLGAGTLRSCYRSAPSFRPDFDKIRALGRGHRAVTCMFVP